MNLPLRHLSIRVPWHDTGWDARVCLAPRLNGSCLKLTRTAESRGDATEEVNAGKHLDANVLAARGVDHTYERLLSTEGVTKYPDFTIEDMESGVSQYWEHCGILHVPSYRRRWEEKLAWYRQNGIRPHEDGGGPAGTLIITRDEANGSIDSESIAERIRRALG